MKVTNDTVTMKCIQAYLLIIGESQIYICWALLLNAHGAVVKTGVDRFLFDMLRIPGCSSERVVYRHTLSFHWVHVITELPTLGKRFNASSSRDA